MAFELEFGVQDTVDWGKKWLVDFNAGKTQLVSFDRYDNTGAIDVQMGGSVLEEKSSFKDDKTNTNTFKEFFSNLAGDLVSKVSPPSNKSGISSVCNYYQNILDLLPSKFKFSNVMEGFVLKLLKNMNVDKAVDIDNLSGKFLEDGANILANQSPKYVIFP